MRKTFHYAVLAFIAAVKALAYWSFGHWVGMQPATYDIVYSDTDLKELSVGGLYQAAMNADILRTAGWDSLGPNDKYFLQSKIDQCDGELARRGERTYSSA